MIGYAYTSDTYIVDDVNDVIVEDTATAYSGGNERDRIVTPYATALTGSLANLEEIELVGSAAVAATGNAGDNFLMGSTNNASNALIGLAGNDVYRVDLSDTVSENANAGVDTPVIDGATLAIGSVNSVSLANYANFENLEVFKGSTVVHLTGNSGNNTSWAQRAEASLMAVLATMP